MARRKRRELTEREWAEVERIMRQSVRGRLGVPDGSVFRLLEDALATDPERYKKLHAQVRGKAVNEMRMLGDPDHE